MREPTRRPPPILSRAAIVALAVGSALITRGSLAYFDAEELPAFVVEKLPLPLEDVWMVALRIHVVAAAFALPGCLLLLSRRLLRRAPRIHRWLGRITGAVILLALVPAGFYLAPFAKGGLASTLGFVLSGMIMAASMVLGVRAARAGRYLDHRRHVLHVLAQMGVAVVSRAMMIGLDALAVDPTLAYVGSLWLPVLGGVVLVEWITRRAIPAHTSRRSHEATAAALDPASARLVGRGAAQA